MQTGSMITKTTEKQNPKYQDILEAARKVFSTYGYKKASIEEICQSASVAKMTFYKYFKNKTELAKAFLEQFIDQQIENLDRMNREAPPYHEKLRRLILLKIEAMKSIGTLFFDDILSDSELAAYIEQRSRENIRYTLDLLKEGQAENYIRKDISDETFLLIFANFTKFVNHPEFRKLFPDIEIRSKEATRLLFHGIADPQNHNGGIL